jgi:plastocyanin
MIVSRRTLLKTGGVVLAGLAVPAWAADEPDIRMVGNANGSEVWFEPSGLLVRPGATVRWRNDDQGNSHTTTAFHPGNDDHALRIPAGAKPWNSDYLLPGDGFAVTLTVPGVYDYFCIPHEMAGMVGRIVVAAPGAPPPPEPASLGAMYHFPTVGDVLRLQRVPHR